MLKAKSCQLVARADRRPVRSRPDPLRPLHRGVQLVPLSSSDPLRALHPSSLPGEQEGEDALVPVWPRKVVARWDSLPVASAARAGCGARWQPRTSHGPGEFPSTPELLLPPVELGVAEPPSRWLQRFHARLESGRDAPCELPG